MLSLLRRVEPSTKQGRWQCMAGRASRPVPPTTVCHSTPTGPRRCPRNREFCRETKPLVCCRDPYSRPFGVPHGQHESTCLRRVFVTTIMISTYACRELGWVLFLNHERDYIQRLAILQNIGCRCSIKSSGESSWGECPGPFLMIFPPRQYFARFLPLI